MKVKNCPLEWNGSLDAFIDQFVFENLPKPREMTILHRQISELDFEKVDFFVRDLVPKAPRGVPTDVLEGRLFNCDNAPAIWIYNQMTTKNCASIDLKELLKKRAFPLRDRGAREGEKVYCWSSKPADPGKYRAPDGGRWKLCHIFSVKKGIPNSEDWYSKRFIRLIHPFNLFLFPRPIRLGKGYYPASQDLGESESVCSTIASRIRSEVGEQLWKDFIDLVGANEFGEMGSRKLSFDQIHLRWKNETESELQKRSVLANNGTDSDLDNEQNETLMAEVKEGQALGWNDFLERCKEIAESAADDEDVIAPTGFQRRPYIHVILPDGNLGALNADCKVKGIRKFLQDYEDVPYIDYAENKNGVFNKIQVRSKGPIARFPFYLL